MGGTWAGDGEVTEVRSSMAVAGRWGTVRSPVVFRTFRKSPGLRTDQTILRTGPTTARLYPDPLRRNHHFDADKNLRLIFLTNNFLLPA